MKRKYRLLIILVCIVVCIGLLFAYFVNRMNESLENLRTMEIPEVDLSTIDDGVYEGSFSTFPVSVIVNVTVLDHEITVIDILRHDNGKGSSAEVIVDDVISQQNLDVDIISGATYSSLVILFAVADALLYID